MPVVLQPFDAQGCALRALTLALSQRERELVGLHATVIQLQRAYWIWRHRASHHEKSAAVQAALFWVLSVITNQCELKISYIMP